MKLCGFEAGLDQPFFLIAGPCTAESEQLCLDVAGHMKEVCGRLGIPYIFKASYDKANRSSGKSVRGLGLEEGLRIFSEVQRQIGVPVLTDVHTIEDIPAVASVVDVLQTPAFLCRQTDFIHAVATCGKPVNIKKGQFLAPGDMKNVVDKAGYNIRWSARICAGSGAGGGCCRYLRLVHGNPSLSGKSMVGWSEQLAAGSHGKPSGDAGGARQGRKVGRFRGTEVSSLLI